MRFACLGSGSRGNALIVERGRTRLMLDCGYAVRETERRLARLGLVPADLDGILVTHEHSDHTAGACKFARKHDLALWLTHGTLKGIPGDVSGLPQVNIIDSHSTFAIGELELQPFPVPHDAREPAHFVFSDGAHRLGVLTDTGSSTSHIEAMLTGCDALVLECNHDLDLLMNGDYPQMLKSRVAGRYGHLDNQASAGLLAALDRSRLQHLIAAPLSQQNNTPELACAALAQVLGCAPAWIGVADQDEGFAWREII
ncbi:MAG: MBL fold metallo-hydrolase [Burkholderiales bacterium]|nr:MBL fold metallo-hydrolase [Burkholderiales bacterium]